MITHIVQLVLVLGCLTLVASAARDFHRQGKARLARIPQTVRRERQVGPFTWEVRR